MIVAHHQFDFLARLLALLDDERNDIFVHVDASASEFDREAREALEASVTKGSLTFTERIAVHWGGYSVVAAEMILLRAAAAHEHAYYHLLSGSDLPLGSQDEIHDFFDRHDGEEFVHFFLENDVDVEGRVKYFHPFQEVGGKDPGHLTGKAGYAFLRLQQLLGVDRQARRPGSVRHGSAWFSITGEFARYVLARAGAIRREYRMTLCPDEQFVQSLIWNSPFRDRLHKDPADGGHSANARLIDWRRGSLYSPYTFRDSDFDELTGSDALFARKFDLDVDRVVVDRVQGWVASNSERRAGRSDGRAS